MTSTLEVEEQLSDTIGFENETKAPQAPGLFNTVISELHVKTGPVMSFTVTTCVAVAIFPAPSVTVQTTVVVPSGNVAGALLVTLATVQLSAVTVFPKLVITA
jgi:hypothetical protein